MGVMNKNKKTKGCWKSGLLALMVFVVAVIFAVIFLINLSNENSNDARFVELLNREYSAFVDKIDNSKISTLNNKINQSLETKDGNSLIYEGELDVKQFFSANINLKNQLILNNYDLAVLGNYFLGNAETFSTFAGLFTKIINLDLNTRMTDNEIDYVAVFQVNLKTAGQIYGFNTQNLPEVIYVTLSATYNLTYNPSNAITSAYLQINRLIGEDNKYAVAKVLELFDKNEEYISIMAYKPFDILKQIIAFWKVQFVAADNCFVFN